MPAEGVNVYLDPWDKLRLEGFALLVDRIPDTEEKTYRGVTCQRWLVRFAPDQELAKRWIDYGDAVPWLEPLFNVSNFQLQKPSTTFTSAINFVAFWHYTMIVNAPPGAGETCFTIPHYARIRSWSAHLYISDRTDNPPMVYFRLSSNTWAVRDILIAGSDVAGVHLYPSEDLLEGYDLSPGDQFSAMHYCLCTDSQQLTTVNISMNILLQWGNFT